MNDDELDLYRNVHNAALQRIVGNRPLIDVWAIVRVGLEAHRHADKLPALTRRNYRQVVAILEANESPYADAALYAIEHAADYDGIGFAGNPRWYTHANRASCAANAAVYAAKLHALRASVEVTSASKAAFDQAAARMIRIAE